MMMLETLFNAGKSWHEETLRTLQLNAAEFLQEETRDLPATAEAEMFYQHVAQLERDARILEEKLNQLDGQPQ
jgi:ubiquinone biosynthesis protein UbiJ